MGQLLIILAVARGIEQGKSLQELKQMAEDIALRLHIFFAVDTLEYLHRGGRVVHVGIVHANAPEVVQEFQEEAKRRLDCKEIFTVECSPNIAVHVGPGTIGIALYSENT